MVGRISGGVDVIVSGFLLVGSMMRELGASGSVDFVPFVGRQIKRLLPASLFVFAVAR